MNDRKKEADHRIFDVKLFGELEITDGSRTLREDDMKSQQMLKLLACLLLSPGEGLVNTEMEDILWDTQVSDPMHALKNLVYRLRRALADVWPDVKFIISSSGHYYINPKLDIRMDIIEFRTLLGSWESDQEEENPKLLMKVFSLYRGRVLKNLNDFKWLSYIQDWCAERYAEITDKLCRYLCGQGNFYDAEKCALNAIMLEPEEERIHICYLHVCLKENKIEEAAASFRSIIHLFYDDGADPLPDELERIHREHLADVELYYDHLSEIMGKIREKNPRRAMKVSRQAMVGIIRMFFRLETDKECQLVLFTLEKMAEGEEEDIRSAGIMKQFEKILSDNLQRTDIFTPYSRGKYLVLFTACGRQDMKKSLQRIRREFMEQIDCQDCRIHTQTRSLVHAETAVSLEG
ncbi:MAG: bacterial transcriptional activator domain-containing protein [Eubacteriales bacterium]|nr:bacterial transcriptional activator domain-containing protein [Eubacteriales bacterium]